MRFIFIPGFAISDCTLYYHAFTLGLGDCHTVDYVHIDGYTYSGQRCLGDVHLDTVVEECVRTCTRTGGPYILVGHSTGALVATRVCAQLEQKPLSMILFNPITRHPRLWLCRRVPLFTPVMRVLDLLPIPLITHVFKASHFGTSSDVQPAMKYQLWRDLMAADGTAFRVPSDTVTIVITSLYDDIGTDGQDIVGSSTHTTKLPGHTSFRSLGCMNHVLESVRQFVDEALTFNSLYRLDAD